MPSTRTRAVRGRAALYSEATKVAMRAGALVAAIRDGRQEVARSLARSKTEEKQLLRVAAAFRSMLDVPGSVAREPVRASRRFEQLSPRQWQVLERIVAGQPNKVVAFDLGVSEKTVETHRARIMQKLCAGSFAELVKISLRALEPRAAERLNPVR